MIVNWIGINLKEKKITEKYALEKFLHKHKINWLALYVSKVRFSASIYTLKYLLLLDEKCLVYNTLDANYLSDF